MDGYGDLVDDLLAFRSETKEVVVVEEEEEEKLRPAVPALDLVIEGDVEALAQQLEGNPSFAINARDPKTGRSLVHEACARGQTEIVKFLLQKTEADLMLRTMLGRCTPLHLAVTNNYRPIVFLLLSHGADALSRDRFACSPMHYAKSLSVAKLLVQYGGKVLDYNTKKKHAAESANAYSESIRKDHRLSAAERDAAMEVNKVLVKYLEQQAEAEYRVKLERLRQLKKQAKEQTASLAARVPQKKSRRRLPG